MPGRTMKSHAGALAGGKILSVTDLSIAFGGLKAVDGLTFDVNERELFGLIGPNGAGKTTVFNCITQFYRPDHGEVIFRVPQDRRQLVRSGPADGCINLVGMHVHDIIRLGLVRTFQNVEIVREIPIIDNVLIGAHIRFRATGIEQALRLPRAVREEREMRKRAMEVLDFLGIADLSGRISGSMPFGVQKKIELARTLMCDPALIILDEPAAGLNDIETEQLAQTIRSIRDEYACAILLVEHDMGLVMNVCDRVCAISFGKLLACDAPDAVKNDPLVQEAYLGEEV